MVVVRCLARSSKVLVALGARFEDSFILISYLLVAYRFAGCVEDVTAHTARSRDDSGGSMFGKSIESVGCARSPL